MSSVGERSVFLTAAWRDLVMVSYEVDPALLGPFVPRGLTLDTFEGRTQSSMHGPPVPPLVWAGVSPHRLRERGEFV